MTCRAVVIFWAIVFFIEIVAAVENNKIEGISVEPIISNHRLCLRIRWKGLFTKGSSLDIDVTPKVSRHCPNTNTLCHEYGVSYNVSEILLPSDVENFSIHQGCIIRPNCTYIIKVATSRNNLSKTLEYSTPVCVEHICDCSHRLMLPKANISGKILPTNSIAVQWHLNSTSIRLLQNREILLKQIYIRISQYTHSSRTYEKLGFVVEKMYPLHRSVTGEVNDTQIIKINTTLLPETFKFRIIAEARDNFYCSGPEQSISIDCTQKKCICRHDDMLPKAEIFVETERTNFLKVNWSFPLENITDIIKAGITVKHLIINITQANPVPPKWQPIGMYKILLNQTQLIENKDKINEVKIIGLPLTIIQGSSYQIVVYVEDNFHCQGPETEFLLIANANGSAQNQQNSLFNAIFILIVAILVILAMVCITHYIYKNYQKSTSSNWMCAYRNSESLRNIRPISMENNLLYSYRYFEKPKADIFEIPFEDIKFESEIGEGAFGKVFKALAFNLCHMPGTTRVAVKEMRRTSDPSAKEEFLDEIETMKNVGCHENIVQLLGYCTVKEPFLIVMEFVKHGALIDYLHAVRCKRKKQDQIVIANGLNKSSTISGLQKTEIKYLEIQHSHSTISENSYVSQPNEPQGNVRPSLTETTYTFLPEEQYSDGSVSRALNCILDSKELHNFAIQISKGMRHLEEKGITHRDLAARNVLIAEGKILKISDFGLSRQGIYVNTKCKKVPLRWLSIESIRDNLYSSKSDVWAFGVVLWEIGTLGAFPYPSLSNHELLPYLLSGKRLEKPEICTNFLYELMIQCWNEDAEYRPSFKQIVDRLQPQHQKIYVEFSSLDPDYVFPPTKKEVIKTKNKESSVQLLAQN